MSMLTPGPLTDEENGKEAPEFKDQAQTQRILGLLMGHMNDIAETLQEAPEHYEPLLMENPKNGDPIPIIDEWCSGFMKAGTVRNIYAFWLKQRCEQTSGGTFPEVVRREPIRNPNKVGRNEPCPCESGRKFKQCHDSANGLH